MILVDDHLSLLILAGGLEPGEVDDEHVATTSLWYLRVVAALTAPPAVGRGPGKITRILDTLSPEARREAVARVLDPDPTLIEVLHPMRFAVETARMQREHQLNLLAAETLGAATHHGASILVAAPNAGGPIERAAQAMSVRYQVLRA